MRPNDTISLCFAQTTDGRVTYPELKVRVSDIVSTIASKIRSLGLLAVGVEYEGENDEGSVQTMWFNDKAAPVDLSQQAIWQETIEIPVSRGDSFKTTLGDGVHMFFSAVLQTVDRGFGTGPDAVTGTSHIEARDASNRLFFETLPWNTFAVDMPVSPPAIARPALGGATGPSVG